MRLFILLTFLAELAYAQDANDHETLNPVGCGRRPFAGKQEQKIVGGHKANKGDWGWQIGLNWHNQQNSHFCGGVLINSQWVLSAGHCFFGIDNPLYFNVHIGFYDRNSPTMGVSKTSTVSKIIMHEGYLNLLNDIALVKLTTPVTYSDYIIPACVPTELDYDKYVGQDSWSTGWGSTYQSMSLTLSRDLLEVLMPVQSDATCLQKYDFIDLSTGFCVGESGSNKDTCGGDSGGPMVVKSDNGPDRGEYTVAGLTSFGYNCGDGGVVTRLSNYYGWIKDKIKNN